MRKRTSSPHQLSLALNRHGGRRVGAGRPRKSDSGVSHLTRAPLAPRYPVHVTSRVVPLPSLRRRDCYRVVRDAISAGADRAAFRVIEVSVQSNHIHMLCEADDRASLVRGLQGLFVRIAKAINRFLGRSGRVFSDRYHDRILRTPHEVRNALAYVLNNARRHAAQRAQKLRATYVDPCSSAPAFFGGGRRLLLLPRPHSWLLEEGWRRAGPVGMSETPGVRRRRGSG